MTAVPRRLWQLAGALCLAHIALIPVGLALQQGPLFADGVQGITDSLRRRRPDPQPSPAACSSRSASC